MCIRDRPAGRRPSRLPVRPLAPAPSAKLATPPGPLATHTPAHPACPAQPAVRANRVPVCPSA
eukprot:13429638-Alexandrium_andersonii.AAC.1